MGIEVKENPCCRSQIFYAIYTKCNKVEVIKIFFSTFLPVVLYTLVQSKSQNSVYFLNRILFGVWIWVSFIVLSSYGGNLRAFLLHPKVPKPINTIEDLVKSGLPWNMVLYGEPIEKVLEETQDPVFKKFWEEKEVVPYKSFPYDRMTDVYEGNSVMVEYSGFVNNLVKVAFMMPDGEALVHVPSTPLGFNITAETIWAFHPLNPWLHRFEPLLHSFLEIGLIEELQNIAM